MLLPQKKSPSHIIEKGLYKYLITIIFYIPSSIQLGNDQENNAIEDDR